MRLWMRSAMFGALVLMLSFDVAAQSNEALAQQAFAQGQQLAEARQFGQALQSYREANRLSPNSPAPLLGIGLCLAELQQHREALEMLDRYLDQGRNPASRRQAEQTIDRLLRSLGLGTIEVTVSPSNATVFVNGQEIPSYRLNRIRVNAGTHTIAARTSGYADVQQQVRVSAGGQAVANLVLSNGGTSLAMASDASPTGAPRTRQRRGIARQWWFWTIIGTVVVGSGLALGLSLGLQEEDPPPGDWRFQLP